MARNTGGRIMEMKDFENLLKQIESNNSKEKAPIRIFGGKDSLDITRAVLNNDKKEISRLSEKFRNDALLRDAKELDDFTKTWGKEQAAVFIELNKILKRSNGFYSYGSIIWRLGVGSELFKQVDMDEEYSWFYLRFKDGLYKVACDGEYTDYALLKDNIPHTDILDFVKSISNK